MTETLKTSTPRPNRKLWLAAIKPPMYSVAIMPIWVGSAVAFHETGTFHQGIFLTFIAAAILILAWENLSNDVFDSETGVDVNKANSLVNLTGNKPLIFWISNLCLILGLAGVGAIAFWQQDLTVIGLILFCCFLGYIYQGPPFRLSYQGMGEILCFFAFGPLAFAAAYYSQTRSWSNINLAASVVVGIATSLILFCSHFNQVNDDAAVGKKSPIVRLGSKRAAQLLPWVCGSIYGLTALFVLLRIFPVWTLLTLVSLPFAFKLCRFIGTHYHQPEKLTYCRFLAVALHFWSGLLLGLGFIL
ncbi:2-carboxy-1,4-naphthoquinone phytyltransferase [Kovacikia minuta CCNUW1]|uniref:2-carboxy-1,4-naphthoquinone phytyltransferase n=1 Tax=Kovacikia minuta TaxID=2931930 RepID=UPI001CCCC841|nr:2-carboxy-1,4-naphthoquinone phytyltransferase [Kovacikia minuta]UBF29420.1 2-carboxy-1,4-naphthoquinone phytyltransferase [Kovacikia minuta CCNUW1]